MITIWIICVMDHVELCLYRRLSLECEDITNRYMYMYVFLTPLKNRGMKFLVCFWHSVELWVLIEHASTSLIKVVIAFERSKMKNSFTRWSFCLISYSVATFSPNFSKKKAWSQQERIQKIGMFHSLTDEGKILWGIVLVCNDQDNYIKHVKN